MSWRAVQKQNFTRINDLLDFLEIDKDSRTKIWNQSRFSLNVPLRLALKMEKNNLNDPIFRQFVPLKEEEAITIGFSIDPVADASFRKGNKFLKKYNGRALLIASKACAMNCRFCFRQNFDYAVDVKGFEEELRIIAEDPTLTEIILSGGDPLSLSNDALKNLIKELEKIPHIKILRFHSRFPIGIPERIDKEFLEILAKTSLQTIFMIHTNHPLELDDQVCRGLKKIQQLGIPILSQSVLSKGVNDSVEVLRELMLKLVSNGIIPYYLHQLDRVLGTAHFEVDQEKGIELIKKLIAILPGYAVPKYVQEVPGHLHKIPLS